MKINEITENKYAPVIIITAVSLALYAVTLFNGFLYDDVKQVLGNRWITDLRFIPDIFLSNAWAFDPSHGLSNYYRPMMHLVFMATYQIFGLEPFGFHLVNSLFHALNTIATYLLFTELLKRETAREKVDSFLNKNTLALFGALIIAAHPIRTEVVAWVSAIPELSFTLFFIISLFLYIRSEKGKLRWPLALSAISFLISAISKETALVLPSLIIIYDIIYRDKEGKGFAFPFRYIPFLFVIIIYFALRINALQGLAPTTRSHPYLSGAQYFINVFPLFFQQIKMLLLPVKLSIFHVFHPIYSITELRAIGGIIFTVIIFAVFYRLRRRSRLYLLGFAIIILPLLPALFIPALDRNPFAERYLYLPAIGFALILALAIREGTNYYSNLGKMVGANIILVSFAILIALYSIGTVKRNLEWKDRFTLWDASVRKDPDNYFALNELGKAYLASKEVKSAIPLFERSIEVNSSRAHPDPLILGNAHLSLADSYRLKGVTEEAIRHYEIFLKMAPRRFDALFRVATVYQEKGELDKAIARYKAAILLTSDKDEITGIIMNIGNIHAERREWRLAMEMYDSALKLQPGNRMILRNRKVAEDRIRANGGK
jgi:tetratricopeptide (TPR) repeat protein